MNRIKNCNQLLPRFLFVVETNCLVNMCVFEVKISFFSEPSFHSQIFEHYCFQNSNGNQELPHLANQYKKTSFNRRFLMKNVLCKGPIFGMVWIQRTSKPPNGSKLELKYSKSKKNENWTKLLVFFLPSIQIFFAPEFELPPLLYFFYVSREIEFDWTSKFIHIWDKK